MAVAQSRDPIPEHTPLCERLQRGPANSIGTINRLIDVCQAGYCTAVAGAGFRGFGRGTGADCNPDNWERA